MTIQNQTFDGERALYSSSDLTVTNCSFDGPADGESALKESSHIIARDNYYNLRYPFWHDTDLTIEGGEMTQNCRAALWYSNDVKISGLKMYGIKAVRECGNVSLTDCDIISPEFGWFSHDVSMAKSSAQSEYFMLRSDRLHFADVTLNGKYSFQYITDSVFEGCSFDTKDSFWHAKNVVIRNCTIKSEYLAWYSENVTFENCVISGTQPFCYCKGLKLINCSMTDTDLAFEKSDVQATVTTHVLSIKNPASGRITVSSVGQIIRDDGNSKAEIVIAQK